MKILVFGRGVIGSQYGWALENAGHTVDFYVRKEKRDIYAQGINATIHDGRIRDYRKFHWDISLIDEITTEHDYDFYRYEYISSKAHGCDHEEPGLQTRKPYAYGSKP